MRHFPIYSNTICLGVALVFKDALGWKLQFIRDDRHSPVFTLAEIANFITSVNTEFAVMVAKLGFIAKDIEEYTGCPLASIPRHVNMCGQIIKYEHKVNPFLRYVKVGDSPWIADFMVPWYVAERIVFEESHADNKMLFRLEDSIASPECSTIVTVSGNSNVQFCSFAGGDSHLRNVQAFFTGFNGATVKNTTVNHGYVFGSWLDDSLRVCA